MGRALLAALPLAPAVVLAEAALVATEPEVALGLLTAVTPNGPHALKTLGRAGARLNLP